MQPEAAPGVTCETNKPVVILLRQGMAVSYSVLLTTKQTNAAGDQTHIAEFSKAVYLRTVQALAAAYMSGTSA